MKNNVTKKVLSLLLSSALMLGVNPVTAYAEVDAHDHNYDAWFYIQNQTDSDAEGYANSNTVTWDATTHHGKVPICSVEGCDATNKEAEISVEEHSLTDGVCTLCGYNSAVQNTVSYATVSVNTEMKTVTVTDTDGNTVSDSLYDLEFFSVKNNIETSVGNSFPTASGEYVVTATDKTDSSNKLTSGKFIVVNPEEEIVKHVPEDLQVKLVKKTTDTQTGITNITTEVSWTADDDISLNRVFVYIEGENDSVYTLKTDVFDGDGQNVKKLGGTLKATDPDVYKVSNGRNVLKLVVPMITDGTEQFDSSAMSFAGVIYDDVLAFRVTAVMEDYESDFSTPVHATITQQNISIQKVFSAEQEAAQALEDAEKAGDVSDLINDLPGSDDVELTDEASIKTARDAYDALTSNQKKLVSSSDLNKLEAAEAAIKALKDAVEEKKAKDKKAADDTSDLIAAIPALSRIKLSDESIVKNARDAYDALTDDQKKLISDTDVKKISDAEKAIEELKSDEADIKAAKAVDDQILALPAASKITVSDKSKIESVRKAYEALTEAQKKKISTVSLNKLITAEEALKAAQEDKKTDTSGDTSDKSKDDSSGSGSSTITIDTKTSDDSKSSTTDKSADDKSSNSTDSTTKDTSSDSEGKVVDNGDGTTTTITEKTNSDGTVETTEIVRDASGNIVSGYVEKVKKNKDDSYTFQSKQVFSDGTTIEENGTRYKDDRSDITTKVTSADGSKSTTRTITDVNGGSESVSIFKNSEGKTTSISADVEDVDGTVTYEDFALVDNKSVKLTNIITTKDKVVKIPSKINTPDGQSLSVTTIAKGAFENIVVRKVKLPSSVTTLEHGAMKDSDVKKLVINLDSTNKLSIGKNAVKGMEEGGKVKFRTNKILAQEVKDELTEKVLNKGGGDSIGLTVKFKP